MGGIILVIIVVFISVMIRKVATVALELTGLDSHTSSFQALSALTGTGFTTREAELITSHPVRRKIISIVMIIGNAGTVVVIAGLVSSFLNVTSPWAVLRFIVLIIALYFIFKLATHNRIGRALSKKIEEKLRVRFKIQKRTVGRILDLGEDFGVVGIALHKDSPFIGKTLAASELSKRKILVLAIERENKRIFEPRGNHKLHPGDNLICYGNFADMKALS